MKNTKQTRTQWPLIQRRIGATAAASPVSSEHDPVSLSTELADVLSVGATQELDLDTQVKNKVLAGPSAGADAKPAFRLLVADDIPSPGLHAAVTLAASATPILGLTGQDVSFDDQDAATVLAGPAPGYPSAAPAFRSLVYQDFWTLLPGCKPAMTPYTATIENPCLIVDASAGNVVIQLDAGMPNGAIVAIVKSDGSTYTVTFTGTGGDTVLGNVTLDKQYTAVMFQHYSSGWHPLGTFKLVADHDLIAKHTYTGGSALDVVGLSAASTPALLTPSANPGAASAILKSDAAGKVQLVAMGINNAVPAAAGDVHAGADIRAAGGCYLGGVGADPPAGALQTTDYVAAGGGVHVGETTDPGDDVLAISSYSLRRVVVKTGLSDNVATAVFTITTTNEAGDTDGGGFYCHVRALVGHGIANNAANDAAMAYQGAFVRAALNTGAGGNSTVVDLVNSTTLRAATNALARQIDRITMTVTETSEYVQTVNFTVDLSGASVGTAEVIAEVELIWYGYLTAPIIAAA